MNVEKRCEVRGRDERDLVWRIDLLREALRRRSGAILKIACTAGGDCRGHVATVLYRVPILAAAQGSTGAGPA